MLCPSIGNYFQHMNTSMVPCVALMVAALAHAAAAQPAGPVPGAARKPTGEGSAAVALSHYLDSVDALEVGRTKDAMLAIGKAIDTDAHEPWYPWLRGVMYVLDQRPRDADAEFDRAEALFGKSNQALPVQLESWRRAAAVMQGREDPKTVPDPQQPPDMAKNRLLSTCRGIARSKGQTDKVSGFDAWAIYRNESQWQLRSIAQDVVSAIKNAPPMPDLVKRRAVDRFKRGDAIGALRSLDSIWEKRKTDGELANWRGIMLLWTGNPLEARNEFDRGILFSRPDPLAYLYRGFANARIGAVDRAQIDLDRAMQVATEQVRAQQQEKFAALQQEIAAARVAVPAQTPQKLLEQLEQAALQGESFDQLLARARVVHRAHHNTARRYDDYFGDQFYAHTRATIAQPDNPDTFVAAAKFIIDQVALGQPAQCPPRGLSQYRWSDTEEGELHYANQLIEKALRLKPDHPDALAARANVLVMSGKLSEACQWAERALKLKHVDPTLLWIVAAYCEREAISAKYQAFRTNTLDLVSEYSYRSGDTIYTRRTYREDPQAQALVDQLRRLSQRMQENADASRRQIAESGTPGMVRFLMAESARAIGQSGTAQQEYAAAIAADPELLPARLRLAELNLQRAMFSDSPDKVLQYEAEAMEQLSNAYNRLHTTAFQLLHLAEFHIRRRSLEQATTLLVRASQLDPTDMRVMMAAAYIDSLRGQYRSAEARYRVALALDEARAGLTGVSLKSDATWIKNARRADKLTSPPNGHIFGRTAIARLCLAALLIEAGEPQRARPYLEENIAMLEALDDPDVEVRNAIAPGRRIWASFGVTADPLTRERWDTVSMLTQRTHAALDAVNWAASNRNQRAQRLAGQIYRRMMLEFQPYGNGLEVRAMGQLCIAWAEQQIGRQADAQRRTRAIAANLPPEVENHLPIRDGQLSRADLRAQQRMFEIRLRDASSDQERQRMAEEVAKIARQLSAAETDQR